MMQYQLQEANHIIVELGSGFVRAKIDMVDVTILPAQTVPIHH